MLLNTTLGRCRPGNPDFRAFIRKLNILDLRPDPSRERLDFQEAKRIIFARGSLENILQIVVLR